MTLAIETLARRYWQAEESRDITAVLGFFAMDAHWKGPGLDLRGREALRQYYEPSFAAYPRVRVDIVRVIGSDQEAAVEWLAELTDPKGAAHLLRGVNLMTTSDGELITSLHAFFDQTELGGGV